MSFEQGRTLSVESVRTIGGALGMAAIRRSVSLRAFAHLFAWLMIPGVLLGSALGSTPGSSAAFLDSVQLFPNERSDGVAIGDLDNDGHVDVFIARWGECAGCGVPNRVWLNDGTGMLVDTGQALGNSNSDAVALGDLDNDGDLDAFIANTVGEPNRVWLNDGAGMFTDSGQALGSDWSQGVALGDIDGDGDLDAFVANSAPTFAGAPHRIWLNDGAGIFTDWGLALGMDLGQDVALGDLDGDGDLDAYVATSFGNTTWFQEGGGFVLGETLGFSPSNAVSLGDVDGDGDLDAFVANGGVSPGPGNIVWLNDGQGAFATNGQVLGDMRSIDVALGDLDCDGDLDAFVANGDPTNPILMVNEVWLNDGSGMFVDSGQGLGARYTRSVGLADFDEDGDLDAYAGNVGGSGQDVLWLNGTISACQGIDRLGVLFVNGSRGAATGQTLVIAEGAQVEFAIRKPPAQGPGKFVVHLNAGAPSTTTLSFLPFGLARSCFAFELSAGATPSAIWNSIGKTARVGESGYFGNPMPSPGRAPVIFLDLPTGDGVNLPMGTVWTLQGIIQNPTASSSKLVSVTNAVELHIQ